MAEAQCFTCVRGHLSCGLLWGGSTGKYSTKQTAKIRYLPRVKKGVNKFAALGGIISKPDGWVSLSCVRVLRMHMISCSFH